MDEQVADEVNYYMDDEQANDDVNDRIIDLVGTVIAWMIK